MHLYEEDIPLKKALLYIALAAVLIAAVAFLIPSSVPVAGAEDLPAYQPVTLAAESVDPIPMDVKAPYRPHEDAFLPGDAGYLDNTISVRIESIMAGPTRVWLTWVQIADPSQLRTAAHSGFRSNQLSNANNIARREGAVLAINGDYPFARSNGIVIRNGEVIRLAASKSYDGLVIDGAGDMHIMKAPLTDSYGDFPGGILQAFTFGPGLVIDGEPVESFDPALNQPLALDKKTQRCVLCQMDTLSYLIICTEGPDQSRNGGLTMAETLELVRSFGVKQAYNLDGGSSAWLVLGDKRINAPTGKKRAIQDIIYFVTAEPAPEPTPTAEPGEVPGGDAAEPTPEAPGDSVVFIGQ